jgi:hypothetical protein
VDILEWLVGCRKEAANIPILRETLTQYINLIKKLTNQNQSTKMNDEIVTVATGSNESLAAFFSLCNAQEAVYTCLLEKLRHGADDLANSLQLKLQFNVDRNEKDSGFYFGNKEMDRYNIRIGFEFENKLTRDLVFGFKFLNLENKEKTPVDLYEIFKTTFPEILVHGWWPCYAVWHERRRWNNESYKDVLSGIFRDELKDKLEKMLGIVNLLS